MLVEQNKSTFAPKLIQRILNLRDQSDQLFIEKFTISNLLFNIEKHQIQVVQTFSKYLKDGFNLLQFVRFFLNIIPHRNIETLYLALGLVDLFREVSIAQHKQKIEMRDITNYMCDKILKTNSSFNKIEAKYNPFTKFVKPTKQSKPFLQNPPPLLGEADQHIHKLCQKSIKTDSNKHSRAILKSEFSSDLKQIFILDSLSESISIYDDNCNLQKKLTPHLSKLKKEVIILSFALSKRQFRIGAVLKDFTLKFWDHQNKFQYEKSISTTSFCQNLQTNIYFLEHFNSWVTTDKTGVIYLWNLLDQKPQRKLKCKYSTSINDLCQISAMNLLVIVQECKRTSRIILAGNDKQNGGNSEANVVLYNFFTGHIITEIQLGYQRIPHTILYSETYQALFMSGLEKKIKIYELHPIFMDASLKGELIGHENLITSFTLISNTPMLISADDKGKVKLWDFRNLICLQTIDFSDKTVITNLLDMIDIGKVGVFGSRVNFIQFENKYDLLKKINQPSNNNGKIEWVDIDENLMEMFVFSNKMLRVIDLHTGQLKLLQNLQNVSNHEDYTIFRYFSCLRKYVLGNTKGEVAVYDANTGEVDYNLTNVHDGGISFIDFDQTNKLFLTAGYDSKIAIHRTHSRGSIREMKNNFWGREINCIELSVYHNLIAVASHSHHLIYLWNYEYGKLVASINLEDKYPTCLHFINGFSMLLVGTVDGTLLAYKFNLINLDIQIELIGQQKIAQNISGIQTELVLKSKNKSLSCQSAAIVICCDSSLLLQYDVTNFLTTLAFKSHCKEKSNYNPFREAKQNFTSEIQKIKQDYVQKQIILNFINPIKINCEFNSISIFKMVKLQKQLKLTIGNERRIKIWDQKNELVCDLNFNYCLPYKWNLHPSTASCLSQKIYYAIKIMGAIIKKYQNDISIGEAKNLDIKELMNYVQRESGNRYQSYNRVKMITEPDDYLKPRQEEPKSKVVLLQDEYSRKDLNFHSVKRFNFTEIAGPTLKELDNIKKLQSLQRDWKTKEAKHQKQKQQLLRSIQFKAQKNEEKDQVQYLLSVKNKRFFQKERDTKIQTQKLQNLNKKLNLIESPLPLEDKAAKTFMSAMNKNYYNKLSNKIDGDSSLFNCDSLTVKSHSKKSAQKSFEEYYRFKKNPSSEKISNFREILTQMNGRIKSIKKQKLEKSSGQLLF